MADRHMSWLSFNYRVLQEACDSRHPPLERLRFLAIFSSNLDEFFRVRVPPIQALRDEVLLESIRTEVDRQQREFGRHYLEEILPAFRSLGIRFIDESELDEEQTAFVSEYWNSNIRGRVEPFFVEAGGPAPFLENQKLYLAVDLEAEAGNRRYAIVEIPARRRDRFIEVPERAGERHFIFLDDIVRLCLPKLFPGLRIAGSYEIKLSRDAELHIEDEFSGDLLEKIREALRRRKTGVPSRLLYDPRIPEPFLNLLRSSLRLYKQSLIPGWRYHNFSDFFDFGNLGIGGLEYEPLAPVRHHALDMSASLFDAIREQDRILHYPYHSYDYVIRFLNEAASDPFVSSIDITLYRVAHESQAVRALVRAARNGKQVTAFIEMKARFDEEANFFWADELRNAGARVVYSMPGLKVHCKMCLVVRTEAGAEKLYGYLSTGNFNERTARVYTDHGLFTADNRITREVRQVFDFLAAQRQPGKFEHLLVAPFNMRQRFTQLMDREIQNAQAGRRACVILKVNNLEDPAMIQKLSEASAAGVEIRLIVRSVCCLPAAGGAGSQPIEAISIVDRFLEHGRVYIYHNGGDERYFIGSADWMTRNLNRRVEVVLPILDQGIQSEIRAIIDIQMADNVKARRLDEPGNRLRPAAGSAVRSQMEIYRLVEERSQLDSVSKPS